MSEPVSSAAAWIDASSGASGDMLLGALVGAGVPVGVMAEAVDRVAPGAIALESEPTVRGGLAATRCVVRATSPEVTQRTWRDVEALLNGAGLHEDVRSLAHDVFARLAEAEGRVHGVPAETVHFHEVGALDAIADVVGVCAGFVHLGEPRLVVSPVALGGGRVDAEHGRLPVPAPAVVELLRGLPSHGGPVDVELCTPTGAALLVTLADEWGRQPLMAVEEVGLGAGSRDPQGHANVLRLLLGRVPEVRAPASLEGPDTPTHHAFLVSTNVDDLDPRIWPSVIAALLEAGASDAWLTPIVMKKGRPAHTLSALAPGDRLEEVRVAIYRHTSSIGLREQPVGKHALDREMVSVEVEGQRVAVKLARIDGEVINAMPEYDDVAAAALTLGRPVKDVLARARGLAEELR